MKTDRELMQQALEALENAQENFGEYWPELISALRERLAREEEDETGGVCARCGGWVCDPVLPQPAREWVGLSELKLLGAYEEEQQGRWGDHVRGLRNVESKLREKNGGGV